MKYPDFVIAGAPKCGSFTLYNCLMQHPEICMSKMKEPSIYHKLWGDYSFEKEFPNYNIEKLCGDGTIGYLVLNEIPERIHSINPETKLIFILRDPVQRTFSHYWHRVKKGIESRSWEIASNGDETDYLIDYSLYFRHIKKYYDLFGPEQIEIIFLEEFKKDIRKSMESVFGFLGVDKGFSNYDIEIKNVGFVPKSTALNRFIKAIKGNTLLKSVLPSFIKNMGKSGIKKIVESNVKEIDKSLLTPKQARDLYNKFEDENQKLANLLGRELPWKVYK